MAINGTSNQAPVKVDAGQSTKGSSNSNLAEYNRTMRRANALNVVNSGTFKVSVRAMPNKATKA